MKRHLLFIGAAIWLGVGLAPPAGAGTTVTRDGERYMIDNSTAAEAKKKLEAAGYKQVRDLKKGLDNFWHGSAVKDGTAVHVVLAPDGTTATEE